MTLNLLVYNNYFNRQILMAGDDLSFYEDSIVDTLERANFNPNDGVDTEVIVNTKQTCDYLIVSEDNSDEIVSR